MMLGSNSSSFISNSGDVTSAAATATAAAAELHDTISGGAGGGSTEVGCTIGAIPSSFSEDDKARIEESERGGGGNRWPRQETLDLLKIRSDMDDKFRDSSLKGPLWEEVSRKMAELGYQRSAKKCKEKFENVYKYHKRTKDGRATKSDGKTYRFFDQLEALENNPNSLQLSPQPRPNPQPPLAATPMTTVPMPASTMNPQTSSHHITVLSTSNTVSFSQGLNHPIISSSLPASQAQLPPPTTTNTLLNPPQGNPMLTSHHNVPTSLLSNSTSSSTSSDEDIASRHKRKRKWKDYFDRLIKDVVNKQEELQKKFLETLEKRERDRMIREEAWRVQEMARMNREIDLLSQERSMASAKDAAVIAFLQKFTEQQNLQNPSGNVPQLPVQLQIPQNPSPSQLPPQSLPQQPPPSVPILLPPQPAPAPLVVIPAPAPVTTVSPTPTTARWNMETPSKTGNGGENYIQMSSSRWPKAEVHALIRLRTNLDTKYQENGPKGPLWEEISAAMRKLGYNRNSKRCKEKWENINKYFKKVKESNKRRPEHSKTCPYFQQLDALYKEKTKPDPNPNPNSFGAIKPENPMVPIMARPEQQWPLPPQQQEQGDDNEHDLESDNIDHNDHDDDDDDDGDDEDGDDEGGGYEIVTNKPPPMTAAAE